MWLPDRAGPVVAGCALAVALFAGSVHAQAFDVPHQSRVRTTTGGFLLGDDWRYQPAHRVDTWFGGIVKRFFADLVAIPANVPNWDRSDWALFTTAGAGVAAFMVGDPPLDVRAQAWSHRTFGLRFTRLTVWQPVGDVVIYGLIWGGIGTMALRGLLTPETEWIELVAMIIESFAVGEIYHAVPKLLIGREGPKDGQGQAVIHGPTASIGLWPAGTPSGHAMSTYAMMGAIPAWFDNPWLTAAMQVFGFAFCATMVTDDYHFVSDIIWGATEGWSIGSWVVRHRSSRYVNEKKADGPRVSVLPMVLPREGAVALSVGVSF